VTPPDRQAPEEGWDSLKVDELKEELDARGLPKSGTKAELVARLEESDAGQGDAAAAAETPEVAEAPAGEPGADEVEEPAGPEAEEAEPVEAEAEEAEAAEAEETEDTEADEADAEAEVEAEEAEEGDAAAAPATRRRGSAETSPATRPVAPRREDGEVVVRARSKYVRSAPRKARLVMDHIRGKEVDHARAILLHAPRAVADDILKLLNSAVANAESNYELGADELRVRKAFVDEGPTIKRFRPRALGRATRINKRTSHMTIELTTTGNGR
jgi:ribosomal protein L22